ncbi:hypothetical protein EIP86_006446 [Pleurotus ostreatoroseus]|nr:hypothetical protein EIP86_006446 [Pleurotus ostreatoroseus]
MDMFNAFNEAGDLVQNAYLLYEPLLEANYRLFHYIGREDANCGWTGVLAFLKIIRSRYQDAFIAAPDLPWWTSPDEYADVTTVRAIGPGAGNMTYMLVGGAGHFVLKDQPVLTKMAVDRWIENKPWF